MSTAPPGTPATAASLLRNDDRIRIYGHSSLFYWWPVWAFGFLLTAISLLEGTRILHVPAGTAVAAVSDSKFELSNVDKADAMKAALGKYTPQTNPDENKRPPRLSQKAWMGASFCILLLMVIAITNIPLRGLWSVVVIVSIILLAVIFALAGLWDDIFHAIGGLHIYIGMAGYLFVSVVLFLLWLVSMLVFDRQIYMTFEPGQMKVCEEVGGGEKSYDTMGMSIEKHRDDLFRHWVLGLGSGDLTVRTSGATAHQMTLNNVLFVSAKLEQIEQLQREKSIRIEK